MICEIEKLIDENHLLKNVKTLAVGVSGGADSMCLLHVLNSLKSKYNITLKAVHVNHNIRGEEANHDEQVTKLFCKNLGVECLVFSENVIDLAKQKGISVEECGRLVRYEAFQKANCDAVATAHSLSDKIETMVFNLVRGTSLKGLVSIPIKRQPNIIRPLINCTREQIEKYCIDNQINFVTDSTNLSDDYTRNFIRHNIVDNFSKVNANYQSNICRCMQNLETENDFLNQVATETLSSAKCENGFNNQVFLSSHKAIRRRMIAIIIEEKLNKPVETRHIELVEEIIISGEGKLELTKDLYIQVKCGIISFLAYVKSIDKWCVNVDSETLITPVGKFMIKVRDVKENQVVSENMLDFDKLDKPLTLRSRNEKDVFSDPKRKHTKKLKKLFNEMKIPTQLRNSVAILSSNETVSWLEGVGVSKDFVVTEDTKKVLEIQKEGNNKND